MKYLKDIKDWKELKNEVIVGDCLEGMKMIPDKSIDAVICDPPYGTTGSQWDSIIPFDIMWKQLKRIIKKNGAIVLFGSQPFTSALVMSNPKWFRHEWIWEKDRAANFLQANIQPLKVHENILVFCKVSPKYFPIKIINPIQRNFPSKVIMREKRKNAGINIEYSKSSNSYEVNKLLPRSIQKFKRENGGQYQHPTQKPIDLMRYLIETYTIKDDVVLDFASGSWTTARACKDLGRDFIGFELEEDYCKIGEERLKQQNLF